MSENMTVFFVEWTGHVLGAVTRAAGVGQASRQGPIQEDVLVAAQSPAAVLLEFPVPGKELSTLVVDPLPSLFQQPLSFQALKETDAQGIEQRPKEVLQLADLGVEGTLLTGAVEVKLGEDVDEDTKVWIMITGGALPAPLILRQVIPDGRSSARFPIPTLAASTHNLLVLVEGGLPFAATAIPGP